MAKLGLAKLCTFEVRDANGAAVAYMKVADLITGVDPASLAPPLVEGPVLWKDPTQPLDVRVKDLVRRMSLAEKASQMRNTAPAIPRLGLPAYDYWNECLHGVARAGLATVFPQAIGLAATWDTPLLHDVADTIATEARAKHQRYARAAQRRQRAYFGLTFWTPNINIFRDPALGPRPGNLRRRPVPDRAHGGGVHHAACRATIRTTSRRWPAPSTLPSTAARNRTRHTLRRRAAGAGFLRNLPAAFRGRRARGPRRRGDGRLQSRLRRTGLRQPAAADATCCASNGVSTAMSFPIAARSYDIFANHKFARHAERAAAARRQGRLRSVLRRRITTSSPSGAEEADHRGGLDAALGHAARRAFRLGLFDPPTQVPTRRSRSQVTTRRRTTRWPCARPRIDGPAEERWRAAARPRQDQAHRRPRRQRRLRGCLLGNYNGTPSNPVTILDGIAVAGPGIEVYHPGCPLAVRKDRTGGARVGITPPQRALQRPTWSSTSAASTRSLKARRCQVTYEGFGGGDRTDIELPAVQDALLKALHATGKPVVLVNCSGSAMAWFGPPRSAGDFAGVVSGQAGGQAVGEALFGDANPAGRLPVTFYRSTDDLPPFNDYR